MADKNKLEALKINQDYRLYYCKTNKRNYLTLGYFGGGVVKIGEAEKIGRAYAEASGFEYESLCLDEITHSRRFKRFKVLWSNKDNQKPLPKAEVFENVWGWLTD